MKTIHQLLIDLDACDSGTEWANDYKTIEEIVANCHRGDWLLWLAKRVNMEIKPLTLAKVRCAQTVIHLMKDERSLNALKVAERFALTDEVSLDDLKNAANAAYAANAVANAAAYAAANAADAAAYAAPYAANAADAAAYAAAYAAANAANAADAAAPYAAANAANAAAADDAAIKKNQLLTADICREHIGKLLIELVNNRLN
jgi:hypothetical protein